MKGWTRAQFDNFRIDTLPGVGPIVPQSQMTASASSETAGSEAGKAVDGDNRSGWTASSTCVGGCHLLVPLPQSITLDLGGTYSVTKLRYLPRQDGGSAGNITSYNVYVSMDGVTFNLVASDIWANSAAEKSATFAPVAATHIRLEAVAGISNLVGASELNVEYVASSPTPDNPVPSVSSLNPSSSNAGDSGFGLVVNGSNFINGSVVRWNGVDRATTYVNSTSVTATIPATDIATAGSASVTVFNPAPGGGASNGKTFAINGVTPPPPPPNPVPSLSSLSPGSSNAGDSGFALVVNGANFVSGAIVRWNGANRATTYVNASRLTANILPADIATAGSASVTVFNPASGGGASNGQTFTINSVSPPPPPPGSPVTFIKTDTTTQGNWKGVYGSGAFRIVGDSDQLPTSISVVPGGQSQWTWANSTNDVRALQKASGTDRIFSAWYTTATGGTFNIDVNSTDGNTHQIALYMVDLDLLGRAQNIRITDTAGSKLDEQSVSDFNQGKYLVWTFSGHINILVTNTAGKNAVLNGVFLDNAGQPSLNPLPAVSSLAPASVKAGDPGFSLVVDGTNFVNGSVVRWNGADRVTAYVSPTRLTASILTADLATAGSGNVTVFTPAPGGGLSNTQTLAINTLVPPPSNPLPSLSSINPVSANAGDPGFVLALNGTNFMSASVVRWNGSNRPTTFLNATLLTVAIPAADIATAGTASVTVFNPTPGGGLSNPQTFTINPVVVPPTGTSATFVKIDAATKGNWKGVYGSGGYSVIADSVQLPSSITLNPSGQAQWTWSNSTNDVRVLQKASGTDRIAAVWYTPQRGSFSIEVNSTGGQVHPLALYMVDWDNGGRAQTISILDATTNAVLDTRMVSGFTQGAYLVWNFTGRIKIVVTNTAGLNGVLSGIFF